MSKNYMEKVGVLLESFPVAFFKEAARPRVQELTFFI